MTPTSYISESGNLVLVLPVPDRNISPNARRGESRWAAIKKSKIIKAHRELAKLTMTNAVTQFCDGRVPTISGYKLSHFFKTAAHRDDDNADGACKAYRDGIAEALGVDDKVFRKQSLSSIGKCAIFPRVEVTLFPNHKLQKF